MVGLPRIVSGKAYSSCISDFSLQPKRFSTRNARYRTLIVIMMGCFGQFSGNLIPTTYFLKTDFPKVTDWDILICKSMRQLVRLIRSPC